MLSKCSPNAISGMTILLTAGSTATLQRTHLRSFVEPSAAPLACFSVDCHTDTARKLTAAAHMAAKITGINNPAV